MRTHRPTWGRAARAPRRRPRRSGSRSCWGRRRRLRAGRAVASAPRSHPPHSVRQAYTCTNYENRSGIPRRCPGCAADPYGRLTISRPRPQSHLMKPVLTSTASRGPADTSERLRRAPRAPAVARQPGRRPPRGAPVRSTINRGNGPARRPRRDRRARRQAAPGAGRPVRHHGDHEDTAAPEHEPGVVAGAVDPACLVRDDDTRHPMHLASDLAASLHARPAGRSDSARRPE